MGSVQNGADASNVNGGPGAERSSAAPARRAGCSRRYCRDRL